MVQPMAESELLEDLRRPRTPLLGADASRYERGLDVSRAVSVGIRLNVWKTKPSDPARRSASSSSPSVPRSRPSNASRPELGRSRPPSSISSVDLPWPVGPWIARNSERAIVRSTPSSARTVDVPEPNSLHTSVSS
jgi:hypothetical protein